MNEGIKIPLIYLDEYNRHQKKINPLGSSWKPNVANPKEDKVAGKRFIYKVLAFEPRTEEVLFNQDIFASDEAEAMLKADIGSIAKAKNLNPKFVETRFMKWAEFDEPTLDDRADSFLQKLDGLSGGDSENALAMALLSKLGVKPKAE